VRPTLSIDTQVALDEAKIMGLDDALEYITDDELVEVTPQSIRIRKVRGL
jgi:GTP-binding protein